MASNYYQDPVEAAMKRMVPSKTGKSYFPGVNQLSNNQNGYAARPMGMEDEIVSNSPFQNYFGGGQPTPTPTPAPTPAPQLNPIFPVKIPDWHARYGW